LRSPSRVAVKILCRSLRTSSSTCDQSTAAQFMTPPSGPFAEAPNLSLGFAIPVIAFSTSSPDRVSSLPGQADCPYPVSYPAVHHRRKRWRLLPLVSCCLSATGIGFSVILSRQGMKRSSRSACRPPCTRTIGPCRGFHVPHQSDTTGVGASCTPGTVVSSRSAHGHRPAPAASQRPVPAPRWNLPSGRANTDEASNRGSLTFTRPVFPLPVAPGRNGNPWAFLRASHPAVTSNACRSGDRSIGH